MAVKEIMWVTADGEHYHSKEKAEAHEAQHALEKYFDEHPIFEQQGHGKIYWNDVFNYLIDNPRIKITLEKETKKNGD